MFTAEKAGSFGKNYMNKFLCSPLRQRIICMWNVSVASRHNAGLLRRLRVNLVTRAHGQRGLWDRRLPVGTKMISPQIYHACVSLRTVILIDVVRQWRKKIGIS